MQLLALFDVKSLGLTKVAMATWNNLPYGKYQKYALTMEVCNHEKNKQHNQSTIVSVPPVYMHHSRFGIHKQN